MWWVSVADKCGGCSFLRWSYLRHINCTGFTEFERDVRRWVANGRNRDRDGESDVTQHLLQEMSPRTTPARYSRKSVAGTFLLRG